MDNKINVVKIQVRERRIKEEKGRKEAKRVGEGRKEKEK